MQLVLATNNNDKIKEIKALLDDLPVTVLTKDDFLEFVDPEETGTTLEDNAILKARAIFDLTGLPSLADDSGLEVDALNGAPGVYSSRYAGENVTYADNNQLLLVNLHGVTEENRCARFRCVMAICWSLDEIETVTRKLRLKLKEPSNKKAQLLKEKLVNQFVCEAGFDEESRVSP